MINWNEATPAGSTDTLDTLDTFIQEVKIAVRERMTQGGHHWGAGTDADDGKHMCGIQGTTGVLDLAYTAAGVSALQVRDHTAAVGTAPYIADTVVLGLGRGSAVGAGYYSLVASELLARTGNFSSLLTCAAGLTVSTGAVDLSGTSDVSFPAGTILQADLALSAVLGYVQSTDSTVRAITTSGVQTYSTAFSFTPASIASPILALAVVGIAVDTAAPRFDIKLYSDTANPPTTQVGSTLHLGAVSKGCTATVSTVAMAIFTPGTTAQRYFRVGITPTYSGGYTADWESTQVLLLELRRATNNT